MIVRGQRCSALCSLAITVCRAIVCRSHTAPVEIVANIEDKVRLHHSCPDCHLLSHPLLCDVIDSCNELSVLCSEGSASGVGGMEAMFAQYPSPVTDDENVVCLIRTSPRETCILQYNSIVLCGLPWHGRNQEAVWACCWKSMRAANFFCQRSLGPRPRSRTQIPLLTWVLVPTSPHLQRAPLLCFVGCIQAPAPTLTCLHASH
mmetsp:Transcript_139198/g.277521  ORF Transcript_139198/g.277521 Transcript_139198/m.277521 type:complete len:204 (-) Transcript_139198:641-1252(-)